jgi:hypothetical protein
MRLPLSAAVALALLLAPAAAGAAPSDYGIEAVGASLSSAQAGSHPDVTAAISVKRDPLTGLPYAATGQASVAFPPGLVGNPTRFPTCSVADLAESSEAAVADCPVDSQVGVVRLGLNNGSGESFSTRPLYNLPPSAAAPARLGFTFIVPEIIDLRPRLAGDYGFTAEVEGIPGLFPLTSIETTLWGVPSDPEHDPLRGGGQASGLGPIPFTSNPTRCGPSQAGFSLRSYDLPGQAFAASAPIPPIVGCGSLRFDPALAAAPTVGAAASASGLEVDLRLPAPVAEAAGELSPAALREAVVTLPAGTSLNPAAAAGAEGCSEAEVGLTSEAPIRFDEAPARCPRASTIGSAEVATPLLGEPLQGSVFLAEQDANPFGATVAAYVVAEAGGMIVKAAAEVDLDPATGRPTLRLGELPQLPVSELRLRLKSGPPGLLTTPPACGSYAVAARLTSWGGQERELRAPFALAEGPAGQPCPGGSFAPRLVAGTVRAVAGRPSPFVFWLRRDDGEPNISSAEVKLPRGVSAKLAGVRPCGGQQASDGRCPAASRIGRLVAGVGAGSAPVYLPEDEAGGGVYLAGPYRGAPWSMVAELPARLGPFDLGSVVLRSPVRLDPRTAQLTVEVGPLPQLLHGVPIPYRDLRLILDRPGFIRNPTSCRPGSVAARVTAAGGAVAAVRSRFQVGACGDLGFQSRARLRLAGATAHGGHPSLRMTLLSRRGDANLARARITLPGSELLDSAHIAGVCGTAEFAAGSCPPASVYGHVRAWSPLLEQPLRGPVYLRASSHRLPDLVAVLDGQVRLELAGRIGSPHGRIRVTFARVPDVPLSKLVLSMRGGGRGLFVNDTGLCHAGIRVRLDLEAHDGRDLRRSSPAGPRCRR